MADLKAEIKGLEEVRRATAHAPRILEGQLELALESSLLVLQQNVPPYPTALASSSYRRTGTLGRSLGASQYGGAFGWPDINEVRTERMGTSQARFGSSLSYAPKVVGANQSSFFAARGWWTVDDIANRSRGKITRIFQRAIDRIAERIEGQS